MIVLAGDVGGTTTRLAYFNGSGEGMQSVAVRVFASRDYGSLTEIVQAFVAETGYAAERVCIGVAGPVLSGRVMTPNLPWRIEGGELASLLDLPHVTLINDLQANAYGVPLLAAGDFAVLNRGEIDPHGPIAVISAGTGLGQSLAVWDGSVHRPLPSEGGHADFAPRNEIEAELMLYLRAEFGRVSYERVLSGPGLRNLYRFLRDTRQLAETPALAEAMQRGDAPAAIAQAALDGSCPICEQALSLFVSLYGAEAGNLALRTLATGGLYIGGGIAPKIIERLKGPAFMLAFNAKGRLSPLLERIPVRVVLNDRAALLGAARCALSQTD